MALDTIINVGKYEAIQFIQDIETAKEYLDACINETAKYSGCDIKEAAVIEKENILEFTKSCNKATQRLFNTLLKKTNY